MTIWKQNYFFSCISLWHGMSSLKFHGKEERRGLEDNFATRTVWSNVADRWIGGCHFHLCCSTQHGDSPKKCCSECGRTYLSMVLSRFASALSVVERSCVANRVVNYSSELFHSMTSSNCWSVIMFWNIFWLSRWTISCLSMLFSIYFHLS